MRLEFPNETHEKQYYELIKNFGRDDEPSRLFCRDNFKDFLEAIHLDVTAHEFGVNSTFFFAVVDADIVGAIQIRHHIEHPLLKEVGGHIGYGIGPSFRKKGYATQMLELSLLEAKKLGLEKVLLTCNNDNIGSYKTIEKNGGVFERISKDGNQRRYWINL